MVVRLSVENGDFRLIWTNVDRQAKYQICIPPTKQFDKQRLISSGDEDAAVRNSTSFR